MKIGPYLGVLCATGVAVGIGVPVWDNYVREANTYGCNTDWPLNTQAQHLRLAHQSLAGLYLVFAIGAFIFYIRSSEEWNDAERSSAGSQFVGLQVYGAFVLILLGLISAVVGGCLTDREHLAIAYARFQRAETKQEANEAGSKLAEAQGRHLALVIASLVAFGPLILVLAALVAASRKIDSLAELVDAARSPGQSILKYLLSLLGLKG